MFHAKYLFDLLLLQLIFAEPQINLYYTDRSSENEINNILQHDCFHWIAYNGENGVREILPYCMNESPLKFHIDQNNFFPKYTFIELVRRNITSEQLYFWSAPIDVVEHYQYYLNQVSTSNDTSLQTQIFYNCSFPRFGLMCQYEIDYNGEYYSFLSEIIYNYYATFDFSLTELLCYTHLQCNRGPYPACLDWSEICDGVVDCIDGKFDEENCWQIAINECNENEYRCRSGQCIPISFLQDENHIADCFDMSDEYYNNFWIDNCRNFGPTFSCEEKKDRTVLFASDFIWGRLLYLFKTMYLAEDNSTLEQCSLALRSILHVPFLDEPIFSKICEKQECQEIILKTCPDMFYFPNTPLFLGDIYFAYTKHDSLSLGEKNFTIPYICYNSSHYAENLPYYPKLIFKNRTCFRPDRSLLTPSNLFFWELKYFEPLYEVIREMNNYYIIYNNSSTFCNTTSMYQCVGSSKCIPANYLMDGKIDCPQKDDENITQIKHPSSSKLLETYLKCEEIKKYINSLPFQTGTCSCDKSGIVWCSNSFLDTVLSGKNSLFQIICDGFPDIIPQIIDGRNETDETECEQWPCNNIYTRCDNLWNCPNGEDEAGCYFTPAFNYSSDDHLCVSSHTYQFMILPIHKINDGKIDCLGGIDERARCGTQHSTWFSLNFYCKISNSDICLKRVYLCDMIPQCDNDDDETFCLANRTDGLDFIDRCELNNSSLLSELEKFFCYAIEHRDTQLIKYFSISAMNRSRDIQANHKIKPILSKPFSPDTVQDSGHFCNRGFPVRVWADNRQNLTKTVCFCPPSYYGKRCQYQNERISLTIKFQAFADSWSTLFAIIISLIDDNEQRIIHSHEQFTYLSIRDCKIKFNIYLLYSTRPKNQTNNYAIHIDIYEKVSLIYRGSLLYPILFPFLPVYRLALLVDIPGNYEHQRTCSNSQCVHGRCVIYSNTLSEQNFCQCNRGWYGKFCTVPYASTCALDSIPIGVSAYNRSVCVCPRNRFGDQCLIVNTICETNNNETCLNGGQCVPVDKYELLKQKFTCICPKGFIGDRCETVGNKIVLSFTNEIVLSQSIFIHFIRVIENSTPMRSTTFRTISTIQDSLIIYWSQLFHIVFIELDDKNYYLAIFETTYQQSTMINKTIKLSDRCPHISELFNQSFVQMHRLRRIKYYHLPCRNNSSNIPCFYDDIHFCLCYNHGKQRLANCFEFDHEMKFDCLGRSVCENQGQCFQDAPDCPERSICICQPCFYGTRCQFNSNGFSLSLDAILGYHIQPYIKLMNQPKIVIFSFALTIIFMLVGLINGIVAFITFNNKVICEVGCGLYLLGSSITNLIITFMFGLKFFILLYAQMAIISNRLFLQIQCVSLDLILRICLNMDHWLDASVAVERAVTTIKGAGFRKKKSKKIAKVIIIILLIFIIATSIYDPIYRRLIEEENDNQKRTWCIATYPLKLQTFNSVIHIFYFLAPFIANILSTIIIIIKKTRQRLNLQGSQTYGRHLRLQIWQHKHLFVSPIILIIIALPRLIISFVLKCMKSWNDAWLFLIVYFIAFIPPMLTSLIFISPSKFYKKQLSRTCDAYRVTMLRRLKKTL